MFNFKTSRIGRLINQNILGCIVVIVIIILIIAVVHVLNDAAKEEKQRVEIANNVKVDPASETVIFGSDVSQQKNKENTELLDQFIEYCNVQDIESAYALISEECKEELYPTIQDFKDKYHSKIFSTSKSYDMQSWISDSNRYTYKMKFLEDMLATGKYDNSRVIEDYYTIINQNDEKKININSYITKEEIGSVKEENKKKISVVKKQIYMDYEIYTIEIENNSDYTILLDSKETLENTYLIGEDKEEYLSYIDEVSMEDLTINAGEKKTIDIKFNKIYNPSIMTKSVVFSDIIQDNDIYTVLKDKNKYGGRLRLQIDI